MCLYLEKNQTKTLPCSMKKSNNYWIIRPQFKVNNRQILFTHDGYDTRIIKGQPGILRKKQGIDRRVSDVDPGKL